MMYFSSFASLGVAAFAAQLAVAQSLPPTDNTTSPVSNFLSRPDLTAPFLNVTLQDGYEPGYLLTSTYNVGLPGGGPPGPYIYDKQGNLVWHGSGFAGGGSISDLHICRYKGSDNLCWFQGTNGIGNGKGYGVIMDKNYTIVAQVGTGGSAPPMDFHDFKLLNDGASALLVAFETVPYDLTAYGVTTGQGWVVQGAFQEVDVETGEVLFEWRSLDHVDPSVSYVRPNTTNVAGNGLSSMTGWNYFHINSVDKSANCSSYMITSRHTSSIYSINAGDGSVQWTLSADNRSSFRLDDFSFTYMHDARYLFENETHTVISIYDNSYDGRNQTADESTGKIISIDHVSGSASLLYSYSAPTPYGRSRTGILSDSQGNLQVLPSGHAVVNFGSVPAIAEYNASGAPVFFANFGQFPTMNYRAYSANWTGTPRTSPTMYAYSRNSSAPTLLVASWNGATEVRAWRFWAADDRDGSYIRVGNDYTEKQGFETRFMASRHYAYVVAEALDAEGNGLRKSEPYKVFVPGEALAQRCNEVGCPGATGYGG